MTVNLPDTGFGLSWVSEGGRTLVTKSVAPSFLFVDFETYLNTNICHRLDKRLIDAYVSVNAPMMLLVSLYGWDQAFEMISQPEPCAPRDRAMAYAFDAINQAFDAGADAIVLCDDICGVHVPLLDPLFVVEHSLPLYERLARRAEEVGIPILFHAEGDIRNYYESLAATGFAGVHIAHPQFAQTAELFDAARACGMTPVGGIIANDAADADADELARDAVELLEGGNALICDDGTASTLEDWRVVVSALVKARELANS